MDKKTDTSWWRYPSFASPRTRLGLDCFVTLLTGTNPYRFVHWSYKNLPVTNTTSLGALLDGIENLVSEVIRDNNLNFDLGNKVHDVGGTAIDFLLTARTTEAFYLGHGHSLNAYLRQGIL